MIKHDKVDVASELLSHDMTVTMLRRSQMSFLTHFSIRILGQRNPSRIMEWSKSK